MKKDLTSIEAMLQESLNASIVKSPQEIGQRIIPLLKGISESVAFTDLTIECKLPNWQKSATFQFNKDSKPMHLIIELSQKSNKVGQIQLKLYEKKECSTPPSEDE